MNRGDLRLFVQVVKFGAWCWVFDEYVCSATTIVGASMEPTFPSQTGGFILIDKVSPLFRDYKVGDVVVAFSPNAMNKSIVKRVTALVRFLSFIVPPSFS